MVRRVCRRQEIVAEKCEHNSLDLRLRIHPVDDLDGLLAAVVGLWVASDGYVDPVDWGTGRIAQQRPAMLLVDPDQAEKLVLGMTIADDCCIGAALLRDYAQTQIESLNELWIPTRTVTGQGGMTHDIGNLLQHRPTVQLIVAETTVAEGADDEHPCQQRKCLQ